MPSPFSRPDGLVDRGPSTLRVHRWVQAQLNGVFESWGYQPVDVPLVEYRALYDAETLGAHLFHDLVLARLTKPADFPDGEIGCPSHEVALRPDFTTPLARMLAEQVLAQGAVPELPVRLAYQGPVFREVNPGPIRQLQFHQAGIEHIGPGRDLEILCLSADAANALGLRDWRLCVGHAGLFRAVLEDLGVPGEALSGLANNLVIASRIHQRCRGTDADFARYLAGALPDLKGRMAAGGPVPEAFQAPLTDPGWRTRLPALFEDWLRRAWSNLVPQHALDVVLAVAALPTAPSDFGRELRPLLRSHALEAQLDALLALVDQLQDLRDAPVAISAAASRGISYYTGVTLELHANTGARSTAVCGGGRYAGLHGWVLERMRQTVALRTGHLPPPVDTRGLTAVGLAFGVERCVAALEAPLTEPVRLAIAHPPELAAEAVQVADVLRAHGHNSSLCADQGRVRITAELWASGQVALDGHPVALSALVEAL
jgi:histidyl-tRNA synthetase